MHNIINHIIRSGRHLFLNILNILILIMQRLIIGTLLGPSQNHIIALLPGVRLGLTRKSTRAVDEELAY